jgi:hypothetical protein
VRPRFGYLHVPKAAGSSAKAAINARVAPPTRWCPFGLDRTVFGAFDGFADLVPEQQAKVFTGDPSDLVEYDVVAGHFALPTLLAVFDPTDVVTVLREPRSRVLSHYTFWRGWPEERHALWGEYTQSRLAVELDWVEFLQDPSVASQIDNLILRLVLGPHPDVPADGFIDHRVLPALVDEAIERLDALGHVDVVERGDDCWAAVGAWLEIDLDVGRHNASAATRGVDWSDAIGVDSTEALHQRTMGDRQLWDHAAERLGVQRHEAVAEAAWEQQLLRVATAEIAGLRSSLDQWENSTTARVSRPLRAAGGRLRQAARRR